MTIFKHENKLIWTHTRHVTDSSRTLNSKGATAITTQPKWKIRQLGPQMPIPGVHPLIPRILSARHEGMISASEIESFLYCRPKQNQTLAQLDKAAQVIFTAVKQNIPIKIAGDYDVDGVMSSTILTRTINSLGGQVSVSLPNRFTDGYGLSRRVVEEAIREKVGLLICVDNGTNAVETIQLALRAGIHVLVLDHHEPGEIDLPEQVTVVNPKLDNNDTPYCATGVVWKVCMVLNPAYAENMLDLAAVGTVADVVPLVSENRWIVKHGLGQLKDTKNAGMAVLLQKLNLSNKEKLTPYDVGFRIGPVINATGRLNDPTLAFNLFMAQEGDPSLEAMVDQMILLNQERQEVTEKALQYADQTIPLDVPPVIVVALKNPFGDTPYEGIAGLIAGKLREKYHRPAMVLTPSVKNPALYKGSGRSIEGFSLIDCLEHGRDYLSSGGGHHQAVGLSLLEEQIERFRMAIWEYGQENLTEEMLTPNIVIDAELTRADITHELVRSLNMMEPFGVGNPRPVLVMRDIDTTGYKAMGDGSHFSLYHEGCRFVAFGQSAYYEALGRPDRVHGLVWPEINSFGGRDRVELKMNGFKAAKGAKMVERAVV